MHHRSQMLCRFRIRVRSPCRSDSAQDSEWILWSITSRFVKSVTPRQHPSHFTRGKDTNRIKMRRCCTFLNTMSAISKARRLEYDWLWDGHMSETVSLMRVHSSLSLEIRAPLIQQWSISCASMPLPGCDAIAYLYERPCPLFIRRVRLSKLSILKSRRWKLICLPLPRWTSIHRDELIRTVRFGNMMANSSRSDRVSVDLQC